MSDVAGLHQGQKVVHAGEPLSRAKAAMIMVHGRGATAGSILELHREFKHNGFAYLAPQAKGFTWYPNTFLAPTESNEPGITSGLQAIAEVIKIIEDAGIHSEKIMILGFSQGACLALEFAARNAQRYGGIIGLSGGLIGPEETVRDYRGPLDGTPVFLGCDQEDFHIPKTRVEETAEVLSRLGGNVTMRLYHSLGHSVNLHEVAIVQTMMNNLVHTVEVVNS